jgi:polar amino acid transport system substrate-binding protein
MRWSPPAESRYRLRWFGLACLVAVCAASSAAATSQRSSIASPATFTSAGKVIFCMDWTNPPEEFHSGATLVGSDVDIGRSLASLMGVKAEFDYLGFDGLIAALLGHKCDAIISGMNDTPERAKQVNFVDYLSIGQAMIVNRHHMFHVSSLQELSGKTVSSQSGTTEYQELQQANKQLASKHKKQINIKLYPTGSDGEQALRLNKVDAVFDEAPVIAYYIKRFPSIYAFGSPQFFTEPVGIAVAKDNPHLTAALKAAVTKMYATGSMCKTLGKWQMKSFAVRPHKC